MKHQKHSNSLSTALKFILREAFNGGSTIHDVLLDTSHRGLLAGISAGTKDKDVKRDIDKLLKILAKPNTSGILIDEVY
jgi:hypothetical protein